VVASLWPVDDTGVAEAMVELHELLVGGMEPAMALRRWQTDRAGRDGVLGPSTSFEIFGFL
jgi:hypothetical protein